ncbi:endolysin [Aeromonas phage phiA014S]|uniref:Endolysin n=1 Tax=Aeromonas phage phiA014S TaxID=3119845 RepID=A0ABZ2CS93_9CAUD
MNNTFIKMLAAIEDPAAIERAYQMMAAKRDLLARNAENPREFNLRYGDEKGFKHSVMEPRPMVEIKCADKVDLEASLKVAAQLRLEEAAAPYKLAPSLADIQFTRNMAGAFRLEIHGATPAMVAVGINDGDLFTMESVRYNRSVVRSVRQVKRTAVIHNRFLRVVFVTPTGGRYHFPN